jgi:autotransporter translocation and assembly factor TamB
LIRHIYLYIYWLIVIAVLSGLFAFVVLFNPLALEKLAHYGLQESGVKYESIEGTIFSGFWLKNPSYKKLFKAKKVTVRYDLLYLLLRGISIENIELEDATVDLKYLPKSDHNSSSLALPPIKLEHLRVKNLKLLVGQTITISGTFQESSYQDFKLHVNSLHANVQTRYATLNLRGKVEQTHFCGVSDTTLKQSYFKEYLKQFESIPKRFQVNIAHAGKKKIDAAVHIKKVVPKESGVSIDDADVALHYIYADRELDFKTHYNLNMREANLTIQQNVRYQFSGAYQSDANITLTRSQFLVPQKSFTAHISGEKKSLHMHLASQNRKLQATVYSSDLKRFKLTAQAKKLPLHFLSSLSKQFDNREIDATLKATVDTNTTLLVLGDVDLRDSTTSLQSKFEFCDANFLAQGHVDINDSSPQWRDIRTKNLFPLNFVANYSKEQEGMLSLHSHDIYTTLFKRGKSFNGWGSYKSSRFDIHGQQQKRATVLHVNKHIESVYELINSISPLHYRKFEYYDAELITKSTLKIDDSGMTLLSDISLPWYVAQSDSQTINFGHNSSMKLRYKNGELSIKEYDINMLEHNIHSKKESHITFENNSAVHVKSLWLYDSLKISGRYDLKSKELDFKAKSNAFHYDAKEADITAAVDLNIRGNSTKEITVEGSVNLLDGTIKYYPSKGYLMHDDDIIILQDVHDPKESKLFVNVAVTSDKKLRYKAKNITLHITPDFTIWKELNTPVTLLGMAEISDGKVYVADNLYVIEPSKLYFGGEHPINPYLDMNILYEIDYKKIQIYITNTLEDPVILFSSTPSLSQNDIMSYLLFGTPANSTFEGGDELNGASAANLILGAGLKSMIGDTTGIHVDTLNIISSESGSLGFEVGTRVSDNLRILLKNDAEFSAILQYKLNRWLRLDVDVKETGQGVNLIYVKDLRDPFQ